MEFCNGADVDLGLIKILPEGTIFSNGGYVSLPFLNQLSKGVRFENRDEVYLDLDLDYTYETDYRGFDKIKIKGIKTQKILNCLIKQIYG